MTTCLLLSGLARNVEASFSNIQKALMQTNNPDIFIHAWLDEEQDPKLKQTIIDLYQPKSIVCEKLRPWKNSKLNMDRMMASYAKPYIRDNFVDTFYSCWYSVQQANLLKDKYRLLNDITYDFSIRARFDINYSAPIDCSKFRNDVIHLANRELPPEMIDDRFAFGPDTLMSIYCSGFNHIDYIHALKDKKDGIFCGENLMYEMCKAFGVQTIKLPHLHASHVR